MGDFNIVRSVQNRLGIDQGSRADNFLGLCALRLSYRVTELLFSMCDMIDLKEQL